MELTLLRSLDDICETVRNANARGVKCALLIGVGSSVTPAPPPYRELFTIGSRFDSAKYSTCPIWR